MADEPWKGKKLPPGQVEQNLRHLGCTKAGAQGRVQYWKPPAGPVFPIQIYQTTTEDIETIARYIEQWVKEDQRKK